MIENRYRRQSAALRLMCCRPTENVSLFDATDDSQMNFLRSKLFDVFIVLYNTFGVSVTCCNTTVSVLTNRHFVKINFFFSYKPLINDNFMFVCLQEIQLDPVERRRDVKDILRITQHAGWRPDSSIFDFGGWFPFLAQCFRLKRFPFPQVSGKVLKDERLRGAIEQAAKEAVNEKKQMLRNAAGTTQEPEQFDEKSFYMEMLKKHEKRAARLVNDMKSRISDFLLRLTSWVLYKLLPCFLSGVVAHPAQVEMLKAAAAKAPGAPLIYLPLHRSHLDYILVSFILLNNDIRSPIVAAGNNLRIPFFGFVKIDLLSTILELSHIVFFFFLESFFVVSALFSLKEKSTR